jgi:hypothetical protein
MPVLARRGVPIDLQRAEPRARVPERSRVPRRHLGNGEVVAVAILVGHGAIDPVEDAAAAGAFRDADLADDEPPRPVAQRHAVPGERVEHLEQRRQDRDVRGELPRHHQRVADDAVGVLGDDPRRGPVHALEHVHVVADRDEPLAPDRVSRQGRRQILARERSFLLELLNLELAERVGFEPSLPDVYCGRSTSMVCRQVSGDADSDNAS